MSLEATLARIAELRAWGGSEPAVAAAPPASRTAPAPAASFAPALAAASSPASRMVEIARGEVGVAESPPGSNDSPRIAEYRTATAGAGIGPWCAYFVSWAARSAGTPLMDRGEGSGDVDAIAAWAQRSGRWSDGAAVPRPGDLIVWDEHIGLVEEVLPDGRIQSLEGNSSDRVSRRIHPPGSALGFIALR